MVFGPGVRDHDSQNQHYLCLETPGYSKPFKTKSESFPTNIMLGSLAISEIVFLEHVGQSVDRETLENREYGIKIFKKHELGLSY